MNRIRERLNRIAKRIAALHTAHSWIAPVVLVLLALAVATGIPGYVASRPWFFERYQTTQKYYASWVKSTHAEVGCEQCHIRPDLAVRALHRLRMIGEFYAGAIAPSRAPKVFGKPPSEACKRCHYTGRAASPSGDLKIPHRAHVDVLKLPCVRCHKWVVHFKNPEGKHSPRMQTCLVCHDGKQATRACSACHKRKSFPVSHRAKDWLVVHGERQNEVNCSECHGWVPDFCRVCHSQAPGSHAGKWRTTHGRRVAGNRNCEACHKARFCVKCHGELPRLNISRAKKFVD